MDAHVCGEAWEQREVVASQQKKLGPESVFLQSWIGRYMREPCPRVRGWAWRSGLARAAATLLPGRSVLFPGENSMVLG